MGKDLEGKVAIITGGLGGIGRATVIAFAQAGADVVIFDLRDNENNLVRELELAVSRLGRRFLYRTADVTVAEEVELAVADTISEFKHVDILVNVAGMGMKAGPLEELSETDWDWVIRLNLKGVYVCTKAIIQHMKERRSGKIVNMSSQAGRSKSELSNYAYAAAKAGVLGFTRQLAYEVGPLGVRVNAIAPGVVLSNERVVTLLREMQEDKKRAMLEAIPLRRFAEADEVASVAVFLASENSSYVTGATIDVNGGRSML